MRGKGGALPPEGPTDPPKLVPYPNPLVTSGRQSTSNQRLQGAKPPKPCKHLSLEKKIHNDKFNKNDNYNKKQII